MSIVLYHHPFSRAANVVWMLEELGTPYELRFVDLMKGVQKTPEITALNPMGKLPILVDGETVITEAAAIGLYLADRYSLGLVRSTHDQNLLLADVRQSDLYTVWQALLELDLATANIGTLTDMICCPGLDFCSLANARSIPIAEQINERFDDIDHLYDLGEIQLKMSGCMNGCGHHSVGHIGILGVDKSGEEWYQITLGGSTGGQDASLGEVIGPSVAFDEVVDTIERILNVYVTERHEEERFLDTFRRIGVAPFKARVYAPANQAA